MERIDDILGYKNLNIFQDSDFFSFSLDSVFLANYATVRLRDKKIVDFCTGNGVVPLILTKRTSSKIIGVEIQEKLVNLANKSICYNNLTDRIDIILSDVKDYVNNHYNEFDLVLCNPPYFKYDSNSSINESYEKSVARHEILITLSEICHCASKVLKDNGNFCLVHRSERLIEILSEFRKNNIEPKKIKFVHENVNKESTLVLVEGQKCGKVGLKIERPLILYNMDGSITDEYEQLQREVNNDSN